jgi:hypothetical protein
MVRSGRTLRNCEVVFTIRSTCPFPAGPDRPVRCIPARPDSCALQSCSSPALRRFSAVSRTTPLRHYAAEPAHAFLPVLPACHVVIPEGHRRAIRQRRVSVTSLNCCATIRRPAPSCRTAFCRTHYPHPIPPDRTPCRRSQAQITFSSVRRMAFVPRRHGLTSNSAHLSTTPAVARLHAPGHAGSATSLAPPRPWQLSRLVSRCLLDRDQGERSFIDLGLATNKSKRCVGPHYWSRNRSAQVTSRWG